MTMRSGIRKLFATRKALTIRKAPGPVPVGNVRQSVVASGLGAQREAHIRFHGTRARHLQQEVVDKAGPWRWRSPSVSRFRRCCRRPPHGLRRAGASRKAPTEPAEKPVPRRPRKQG
jgi:hypothetical protein